MKWRLIVEKEVVGVAYISLTGIKPGLARGRDAASFSPCYFCFVKLNASEDAAEYICCYMPTNIVLITGSTQK